MVNKVLIQPNLSQETITLNSADLLESDKGLRFALPVLGEFVTGFVVRFHGKAYAYVNQCAHVSVELDWNHGDFFTRQKDYLVCATHGAQYLPDSGFCVMGPCKGESLKPLMLTEQNEKIIIYLTSASE